VITKRVNENKPLERACVIKKADKRWALIDGARAEILMTEHEDE